MAAGDIVQKIFRPSIRQPPSVRVAAVGGRVRSCPGSLTAAASTTPLVRDLLERGRERRGAADVAAATAMRQRRTMLRTATRCMLTPIATEASPRARRLDATHEVVHASRRRARRSSAGIGAAK